MSRIEYEYCSKCGEKMKGGFGKALGLCDYCVKKWYQKEIREMKYK